LLRSHVRIDQLHPNAEIDVFGSQEPRAALTFGLVTMAIGVVLLAIPAVVAIVTLRRKKPAGPARFNEPIPPAS
jgi:hypothetical protein